MSDFKGFKCKIKRRGREGEHIEAAVQVYAIFAFLFQDVRLNEKSEGLSKRLIKERLKETFCRYLDEMTFEVCESMENFKDPPILTE